MAETQSIVMTKLLHAPVKQVYRSFTSSVALESWFADFAELVPAENGRFYAYWNNGHYAVGMLEHLVEEERISFSWRGKGELEDTHVEVEFDENAGQTQIMVRHSGLGTSEVWNEASEAIRSGWETALKNLKSVLEEGLDRRIYDRPMLGIYPSQLVDEEMVSKLNLPVNTGVQIGGVVEGLGAEAAGLQNDDVIFSLNNYLLKDYTDFAHAVADVNAGDVVEVVFYRKDHKHVVNMELSRRPSPEVPESADALSQQVARSYQEFDTQLDEVFSGVTDTQASYRPGSKEWSAKETLVHLLYTERWLHLAISCAVADQRMGGFVNQLELIKAIADSYTLPDLITELKKCEQLTVNSMASLPDEFVADKRRYINFVSSFGQGFAKHSQSHLLQIQSALSAAENQ